MFDTYVYRLNVIVSCCFGVTKEIVMSQTLLEMTKDLVLAQIQIKQVTPEALSSVLHNTYATLRSLQAVESLGEHRNGEGAAETWQAQAVADWKPSITRHAIRCLECGETFKQLSLRHLSVHDLDPRSYRAKYNIPRTQALSAREVTARRRELAQQIRPWELAPSRQQAASQEEAKPKAKSGAAKSTASRATAKKAPAKS
jgi:predicted transcriptional regulator